MPFILQGDPLMASTLKPADQTRVQWPMLPDEALSPQHSQIFGLSYSFYLG